MNSLAEQYRPRTWSELVGQDKAIAKLDILRRRGLAGRAYWVQGGTSSGKTTCSRLIAAEIGAAESTIEDVAPALTMAEAKDRMSTLSLYGWRGGRAWIINEAHRLKRDVMVYLLDALERIPDHAAVIFTTTVDGAEELIDGCADANPLIHRCTQLRLTTQGMAQAAAPRLKMIAEAEGLDGQPVEAYVKLMHRCKTMRAALQAIESGEMLT